MRVLILGMAAAAAFTASVPAYANSISEVEGARAHERQGGYLTRQNREQLRRYGGNDDGYYSGRRGYGYRGYGYRGYGYNGGPSFGIEVGPRYGGYGYSGRYYD